MSYNKLLTDLDREYSQETIQLMWDLCPDIMARKFPRANVQQAFVIDTVRDLLQGKVDPLLLSVGCYEDTAYEVLRKLGWSVIGIDPYTDVDLHTYARIQYRELFDCVFATSVLEHVQNDEEFVDDMCKLIKRGGYGILTMDFNNDYKSGDRLPYTDVRFYTTHDLRVRLADILYRNNCALAQPYDYSGTPDFEYDGCTYSFAKFVFKKEL